MSNHLVNMQSTLSMASSPTTSAPDVFVSSKMGLDDLFQTLEGQQQQHRISVPMRERNLPASFFRPPSSSNGSSAVHSRDSSLDASGFGVGSPQQQQQQQHQQHARSASTSAYAGKPPVHHHAQHQHQVSSPVASTSSACSPVHQYQHSHPSSCPSPLSPASPSTHMQVTNTTTSNNNNNNNPVAQQHYHQQQQHPAGSPAQASSTTSATSPSSSSIIASPAGNSNNNTAAAAATTINGTSPVAHPATTGLASIIHARARSLPASLQQFSGLAAVPIQASPLQMNGGSTNHPQQQQHQHHHHNHSNVLLSSAQPQQQQATSNQLQAAQQPMGKMTLPQNAPLNNGQQQQQQQAHARQHSFDVLANSHHNNNKMIQMQQQALYAQAPQTMSQQQQPQFDFASMIQSNQSNGALPSISQLVSQPRQSQPFNSMIIQQQQQHQQQQQVSLPDGWVAVSAPSGDVYFINERTQTSTWFHPGAPKQMQMKMVQQKQQNSGMMMPPQFQQQQQQQQQNGNIPPELVAALENMHTSNNNNNNNNSINNNNNNDNLRSLQMECERYKQRQEEIMSTPALKSNYFEHTMAANNAAATNVHHNDPFLGIGVTNVLINGMNSPNSSNLGSTNTTGSSTSNGFANGNGCEFLLDFNQNLTPMNNNGGNVVVVGGGGGGDGSVGGGVGPMSVAHDTGLEDIAFDNFELDNLVVDGIDLLNDVEELLNSNKDSLMTWL